jgi:NAD+ synthase
VEARRALLDRLVDRTRAAVGDLGRRGAVVAVSGGVDSGVAAGICVRALGGEHVLCLRMPERDAGSSSSDLGLELARTLGAETLEEPITAALEGLGCYARRDEAIRSVFPDYEPTWAHKLVRSAPTGALTTMSLVVQRPDGTVDQKRLSSDAYRALISATNMKQRVRKLLEYTWADRLGYAVVGTANLLEHDQGFFVKGGDGLADVKPLARLYKGEVYALAAELGLPDAIATRAPTTDTFSLAQSQEEFFFGHPPERMDLLLQARDEGSNDVEGLSPADVKIAFAEIDRRRRMARYLHHPAVIVERDG